MSVSITTLKKSRLVVGRDFTGMWLIGPDASLGESNANVTTALTGATATARICDTDEDLTLVVAATAALDATERVITLSITDTATADLVPGRYLWDVYVTTSGGDEWPIPLGPVDVCAL